LLLHVTISTNTLFTYTFTVCSQGTAREAQKTARDHLKDHKVMQCNHGSQIISKLLKQIRLSHNNIIGELNIKYTTYVYYLE